MNHELRSGLKWTVNECLRLEREYDLLKLSVEEIALLHQRSPYAIMYKLDAEGIADFNELYQQTYPNKASNKASNKAKEESDDESESESESESDDKKNDDASELSDNEYDRYDLKQQVRLLTKQLSNLTAIVYKFVSGHSNVQSHSAC